MTNGVELPQCRLYVGTENGLFVYDWDGDGLVRVGGGVDGETVRDVSVHPAAPSRALVGCGLRGHGLYGVTGAGETVTARGFADEWVWSVRRDPGDPDRAFVGTEPAGLHRGRDDGDAWARFDGLDDLPSRLDWSFPHGPFHDGHVAGIAIADDGDLVVAAVEHGTVAYSHDGGESWREALVGADAHDALAWDDGRVLVTTGSAFESDGGLFASDDACETFDRHSAFSGRYVKELVRDPSDPSVVYVDSTTGPSAADAEIWRSTDRGRTWKRLADPPRAGVTGTNGLALDPTGEFVLHAHHPDDETGGVAVASVDDARRAARNERADRDPWQRLDVDVSYVRALETTTAD